MSESQFRFRSPDLSHFQKPLNFVHEKTRCKLIVIRRKKNLNILDVKHHAIPRNPNIPPRILDSQHSQHQRAARVVPLALPDYGPPAAASGNDRKVVGRSLEKWRKKTGKTDRKGTRIKWSHPSVCTCLAFQRNPHLGESSVHLCFKPLNAKFWGCYGCVAIDMFRVVYKRPRWRRGRSRSPSLDLWKVEIPPLILLHGSVRWNPPSFHASQNYVGLPFGCLEPFNWWIFSWADELGETEIFIG